MLLICSLIFSGTKAGILSVVLIILFVIIKNIKYRLLFSAGVISSILFLPFWIKYIVSFSSFGALFMKTTAHGTPFFHLEIKF
ncbi:MAG: hypothetical protein CM15mP83_1000 [Flavobacteriaceae bacterium]|nr:MAG: hypothetical protein CM15mP83_1000 [Flavobacteriaceae bacterium]